MCTFIAALTYEWLDHLSFPIGVPNFSLGITRESDVVNNVGIFGVFLRVFQFPQFHPMGNLPGDIGEVLVT